MRVVAATAMTVLVFVVLHAAGAEQMPVFNESIKAVYFESMDFPLPARLMRIQGTVVIHVALDGSGAVVSSTAISGGKHLIPACLANSRRWRFEPNRQKSAVIVYLFKIEGLCNAPCASQFRFEPPNLATVTIGNQVIDH